MPDDLKSQNDRAKSALDKAQLKFDQAKARLQATKARLGAQERKNDTRRKVIIGALVLDEAAKSPHMLALVNKLIASINRQQDRAVFVGWKPGQLAPSSVTDSSIGSGNSPPPSFGGATMRQTGVNQSNMSKPHE